MKIAALVFSFVCISFPAWADVLRLASTPAGATVEINGVVRGKTPLEIKIPGGYLKKPKTAMGDHLGSPWKARFVLEGYQTQEVELTDGPMEWRNLYGVKIWDYWLLKTDAVQVELKPTASRALGAGPLRAVENASAEPRFQCRVAVNVSAEPGLKQQISSYINRELRALRDVVLVDENATIRVSIIGLQDRTVAGRDLGYTLALVTSRKLETSLVEGLTIGRIEAQASAILREYLADRYEMVDHFLQAGAQDELKKICEALVAQIDEQVEAERKAWQKYLETMKRANVKPRIY